MSKPFQAQRAVLYFAFSPDEALTARDLDIKLGLPARAVPTLLRRSCARGLVAKEHDPKGRVTYRAGPELLKMIAGMKRWL
jgi:hypothetical protein